MFLTHSSSDVQLEQSETSCLVQGAKLGTIGVSHGGMSRWMDACVPLRLYELNSVHNRLSLGLCEVLERCDPISPFLRPCDLHNTSMLPSHRDVSV